MGELQALIVDWGGVLTNPLDVVMRSWCDADDIDYAGFQQVMKDWLATTDREPAKTNPAHALERGEIAPVDFERELATRLRTRVGGPVDPSSLLSRMFSGFESQPAIAAAVRRAKAAGLATALLSNSWGNNYPRDGWDEMFDVVVISGEVNLRKPEPMIFLMTCEQLGVDPAQCVFVDDVMPNIRGAVAVGMVGVHHVAPQQTIGELEDLFGITLGREPEMRDFEV